FAPLLHSLFFLLDDAATTELYTLSLHDALPILLSCHRIFLSQPKRYFIHAMRLPSLWLFRMQCDERSETRKTSYARIRARWLHGDRKSTRLNSSHVKISYAVFCLKKKNNTQTAQ